MTHTFNPTTPGDRDRVRLLINDIAAPWKFEDATIDMMLAEEGSVAVAASRLARMLAQQYTAKGSVSLGPLSASYGEQANFYTDLALQLERDGVKKLGFAAVPVVNGDALISEENPAYFDIAMHDDTTSGTQQATDGQG